MNLSPGLRSAARRTVDGTLFGLALIPILLEDGEVPLPAGILTLLRWSNVLFAAALGWSDIRRLRSADNQARHLRQEGVDLSLLALAALTAALEAVTDGALFGLRGLEAALVVPSKAYILAAAVLRIVRLFRVITQKRLSFAKVFTGSFVTVILGGAFLLWALPGAANRSVDPGARVSFLQAAFTATSAVCVTGLTVVDTGETFSRFGQTVIMVLIQVGGLGLMTFAAFFALAMGKGIGFSDRVILRDVLNVDPLATVSRLLAGTVGLTFLAEAVGALLMYGHFTDPGDPSVLLPPKDQAFYAAFHSVSAFCNAGFGLYRDNWSRFLSDPYMSGVVMVQIVLGGIGFTVILNVLGLTRNLAERVQKSMRRRPLTEEEELAEERRDPVRVSLQTRMVLRSTVLLVVCGAVLFFAFESKNVLEGKDTVTAVTASLFQSVATRTAGFSSVPVEKLLSPTLFLFVLLMFVGASPGGTGGGIKTTTMVVLLRTVGALARGRSRVEVLRRSLPQSVISQAIVVAVLSGIVVFTGALLLCLTESRILSGNAGWSHPQPFLAILFETASAFGTVGLSANLTPFLSSWGQVVVMLLMFVGRVGPITLTLAVGEARSTASYEFPEERVMIG